MNNPHEYGMFTGAYDQNGDKLCVGDIVTWTSDHKINVQYGHEIPCDSWEIGEVVFEIEFTRFSVLVRKQLESHYGGPMPYHKPLQYYGWLRIGNVEDKPEIFDGCEEGILQIDGSVKHE